MVRLVIVLGVICIALLAARWVIRWLVTNQVRITLRRLPTDKEVAFLAVAMQALRFFLRLLLRR
jgi:hypothetical protein